VVVIEWVPGTRKDAGEIGRKRKEEEEEEEEAKEMVARRTEEGGRRSKKGVVTATIGRGRSNPREGSPSDILPHPQPSRALNHPL